MKSRIFILVLILCLLLPTAALAISPNIILFDYLLDLNIDPIILNGRSLVPIDPIFDFLDIDIQWNKDTNKISAENETTIIELEVNKNYALINGENIELDVPATIIDGNLLLPARFIFENFDVDVEWDSRSKSVLINSNKSTAKNIYSYYLKKSDLDDAISFVKNKNSSEVNRWIMENYLLDTKLKNNKTSIETALITPYANLVSDISYSGIDDNTYTNGYLHLENTQFLKPLTFSILLESDNEDDFTDLEESLEAFLYQDNSHSPSVKYTQFKIGAIDSFKDEKGYYTTALISFYAVDDIGLDFFRPLEFHVSHDKLGQVKYILDLYDYR